MTRTVRIIGVPMDLGQALRGVNLGPGAVRYAGLSERLQRLGLKMEDAGDVSVPVRDSIATQERVHFLPAVRDTCARVYEMARQAMADDVFPVFVGGDHSISLGTVGGVTHAERRGVLWIDAHGDFNTPETSPSGNIHGMPLASLLGVGPSELVNLGRSGPLINPEDVVLIGIRDLDPEERQLMRELDVCVYTMREIDERGAAPVMHEALARLSHVDKLHVSLDLDSLDPREAPGVGTPVPGGLTYREAHLLMEILSDSGRVASADLVEVNPILDERNQTARMAAELLASLLGKAIL
jgi:arginase